LGILLILGLFRNGTLFVTGLTFISLAFGQILLKQYPTVAIILGYLFMTAVVLFLEEDDRWTLGCCRAGGDNSDKS
jgi:hypothetical protein